MNTSSDIKIEKPQIIQALLSGFNTIANKPFLMFLPIILDLFLWFGPAWRVDAFFLPLIQGMNSLPGMDTAEAAEMLQENQRLWQDILVNFDLASSLRTLPVGVPSLLASRAPFLNPLGQTIVFNLESNKQILGIWLIFLLIGFFLGNYYFKSISDQVINKPGDSGFKSLLQSLVQIMLMPVFLLILLVVLSIPLMFLMTFITLISPGISQFVLILLGITLLWLFMPLVYTPHGIFLYRQNLVAAMMTSINVVKTSMGNTAWYIILSFTLIKGFNYLWQTPAVDDWFLIVGIFGHAFVVSAVIASSFHYFLDATRFTQTVMNQTKKVA